MKMAATAMLILALAGCARHADTPASGPVTGSGARTQAEADAALSNDIGIDPRKAAPGVPNPGAERAPDPLALPTAFQGHWGLTTADCDISRPDAPGLMKVHGSVIDFRDATAKVRALASHDAYRVVADLDYSDPPKTWQRRETLALEIGGTRLARSDAGKTSRYEHC